MDQVKVDTVQNVSVKRFYGYAFDRSSGKYLYTEVQKQRYAPGGRWLGGESDYYLPDGKKIGEKTLDFSRNPYIPTYRLELTKPVYAEGISHVGAHHLTLFKQHDNAKPERKTIDVSAHMAADSGFDSYLQAHWKALMAGKTLHFVFVAAGLLNDYDFKAEKIGDTTFQGQPAVKVKAELSSMLSWFTEPLRLTYSANGKKLLEYRGLSNIINPKTHKVYDVRILYTDKPPKGAPKSLPPLD